MRKKETIGIIGAMEVEVASLKTLMKDVQVEHKAKMDFYAGTLEGMKVVVVRSGIGKVNAAVCTQILIDDFGVDAVINTGIGGSLDAQIDIGDVVVAKDVLHHDVDAVVMGYKPGEIPQLGTLSFMADEDLAACAKKACGKVSPSRKVFTGRVVSGDQFIVSRERKTQIKETFGGLATEMEGAAIAQCAWLNKIPFLVLRVISDKADESAQMDYPVFEEQAARSSVDMLCEMMRMLKNA